MHVRMSSSAETENNPVELNLSRSFRIFISGSQGFFTVRDPSVFSREFWPKSKGFRVALTCSYKLYLHVHRVRPMPEWLMRRM
jgi:hypothetical protein